MALLEVFRADVLCGVKKDQKKFIREAHDQIVELFKQQQGAIGVLSSRAGEVEERQTRD